MDILFQKLFINFLKKCFNNKAFRILAFKIVSYLDIISVQMKVSGKSFLTVMVFALFSPEGVEAPLSGPTGAAATITSSSTPPSLR